MILANQTSEKTAQACPALFSFRLNFWKIIFRVFFENTYLFCAEKQDG